MREPGYLRIEGLTRIYGETAAVSDFNLDVGEGEMIVLLGPSGCGKTTTLRLIAGFVERTSGRILVEGTDYTSLPPYRRQFGLVFQSYALFPNMTVAQNVTFGLRMRNLPKADIARRLNETLALVSLEQLARRYPKELSGGQQQRVALARALAIRPKLLLLDEPLSNLDANLRQTVAREIRKLQKAFGLTAIMVTHDQEEAMTMADRLVLMNAGEIQQIGTQQDLYERPKNAFVARFIGQNNLMDGELADDGVFRFPSGSVFHLAGRYRERGARTLALRAERLRFLDPGDEAQLCASVRVDNATYLGSHIDYQLALPTGETFMLREPIGAQRTAAPRAVGSAVNITWDERSERLFCE